MTYLKLLRCIGQRSLAECGKGRVCSCKSLQYLEYGCSLHFPRLGQGQMEQIESLEKAIKSDAKNLNLLLDLLNYVEEGV